MKSCYHPQQRRLPNNHANNNNDNNHSRQYRLLRARQRLRKEKRRFPNLNRGSKNSRAICSEDRKQQRRLHLRNYHQLRVLRILQRVPLVLACWAICYPAYRRRRRRRQQRRHRHHRRRLRTWIYSATCSAKSLWEETVKLLSSSSSSKITIIKIHRHRTRNLPSAAA